MGVGAGVETGGVNEREGGGGGGVGGRSGLHGRHIHVNPDSPSHHYTQTLLTRCLYRQELSSSHQPPNTAFNTPSQRVLFTILHCTPPMQSPWKCSMTAISRFVAIYFQMGRPFEQDSNRRQAKFILFPLVYIFLSFFLIQRISFFQRVF